MLQGFLEVLGLVLEVLCLQAGFGLAKQLCFTSQEQF